MGKNVLLQDKKICSFFTNPYWKITYFKCIKIFPLKTKPKYFFDFVFLQCRPKIGGLSCFSSNIQSVQNQNRAEGMLVFSGTCWVNRSDPGGRSRVCVHVGVGVCAKSCEEKTTANVFWVWSACEKKSRRIQRSMKTERHEPSLPPWTPLHLFLPPSHTHTHTRKTITLQSVAYTNTHSQVFKFKP